MSDTQFTSKQIEDQVMSYSLYRQALINGNFDIWQRGTSFTGAGYTADRWAIGTNAGTVATTQQAFTVGQTDVPHNPKYYMRVAVSGQSASSDYSILYQPLEGVDKFAGETITISVYAKASSAGYLGIEFARTFGTGGSSWDAGITTTKQPITTSWSLISFTVTLPSVSGKTIGTDDSLAMYFWLSGGSDFDARNGGVGIQNLTFEFSSAWINIGDTTLPYYPVSFGETLQQCQRFYIRWANATGYSAHIGIGQVFSATQARCFIGLPTTMRKAPSIETSGEIRVFVGGGNQRVVSGYGTPSGGQYMPTTKIDVTFATSATDGGAVGLFCSASGSYFALSAEY